MGKNHKKLINNLEKLRRSVSLTQQELSIRAEVSRKSINAIENGVYVPSTVLALKIAKTLKCNVEDLFKLPWNSLFKYLVSQIDWNDMKYENWLIFWINHLKYFLKVDEK